MANCETVLSKDVDINCKAPIQQGLESNAVIINKKDITAVTYDAASGYIVSAITVSGRGYS